MLDVNVLVRAHRTDFPGADKTASWLESALESDERVAVWDSVLISSYRILTHPKLVREPEAAVLAMQFLQEVRDASVVVHSGDRHWKLARKLIEGARATGNLVADAAIDSVCIEHNCRLATYDQDFARFPSLRWFEPTD